MLKPMANEITLALHRGWCIFPLVPSSRFANEQPLLDSASSSIEQIEQWRQQYPDCSWAVATGPRSNVFAVEASRESGVPVLCGKSDGDFPFASTLQIHSQNRVVLFFRWPDVGFPPCQRARISPGLHLRLAGSFVRVPSGKEEIAVSGEFVDDEATVNDAPSWLLEYIHTALATQESVKLIPFPLASLSTHSILMAFTRSGSGWLCEFYAIDGRARIARPFIISTSKKVTELVKRGGARMDADDQISLARGFSNGNGTTFINLAKEQYEKLLAA